MKPIIRKNAAIKNRIKVIVVTKVKKKNMAPTARDTEPNNRKSLHITSLFLDDFCEGFLLSFLRLPAVFLSMLALLCLDFRVALFDIALLLFFLFLNIVIHFQVDNLPPAIGLVSENFDLPAIIRLKKFIGLKDTPGS